MEWSPLLRIQDEGRPVGPGAALALVYQPIV